MWVGQAADGTAAFRLVKETTRTSCSRTSKCPVSPGSSLAQKVAVTTPDTKVVIVTTFARSGYLKRALDAGTAGYLLKDAPAPSLADALRRVHGGRRVVDPELAAAAWGEVDPLTDRERQVLRLAGEGLKSSEIGGQLHLTDGTVRNYLSEAMSKLGASNRVEAARMARARGWL